MFNQRVKVGKWVFAPTLTTQKSRIDSPEAVCWSIKVAHWVADRRTYDFIMIPDDSIVESHASIVEISSATCEG